MGGQGAEARAFASRGEAGRLQSAPPLPPPTAAFPRYVEPEANKKPEPKKKAPKG